MPHSSVLRCWRGRGRGGSAPRGRRGQGRGAQASAEVGAAEAAEGPVPETEAELDERLLSGEAFGRFKKVVLAQLKSLPAGGTRVFPAHLLKQQRQEVHRVCGVVAPPEGYTWRHESQGVPPNRQLTVSLVGDGAVPAAGAAQAPVVLRRPAAAEVIARNVRPRIRGPAGEDAPMAVDMGVASCGSRGSLITSPSASEEKNKLTTNKKNTKQT